MTAVSPLPRLIQDFFRRYVIAQRNLSPRTLAVYRDTFRMFLPFTAARASRKVTDLSVDDLGREAVLAFLDHLETARKNSPHTRNVRLAAIHSFFRFVALEEPACSELARAALTVPFKRGPVRLVTCLDRQDIDHILSSIDRSTPQGRRDAALLQFLYNTGARAQEVVDLRLPALRLESPLQVRIFGKGRKERLCPLWPETADLLYDMLKDRGVSPDQDLPLLVNSQDHPLSRFGLWHIVKTCVARAAASRPSLAHKKISPHTFRHTTALHLIQAGVEINVVKSWLGHASIETTHAYIEIDMKMKCDALEACGAPKLQGKAPSWQEPDVLAWLETL